MVLLETPLTTGLLSPTTSIFIDMRCSRHSFSLYLWSFSLRTWRWWLISVFYYSFTLGQRDILLLLIGKASYRFWILGWGWFGGHSLIHRDIFCSESNGNS